MSMYTIKLDKDTLQQLRLALEVALLDTDTGHEVPLAFDESYYLEANPDVRAAVADKIFRSGYEHYMRHGRAEGRRATRSSAPLPVIEPPVQVPQWVPDPLYLSSDRLVAALNAHGFAHTVTVDEVKAYDGFGPAVQYWTWPDKTVQTRRPVGKTLDDSYESINNLISHAQAIGWKWAVVVDGKPYKGGFDADNGASQYETVDGAVRRVKR